MARKRKESGGGGGGGGWIVTFSDLMTLLLTFFVLLLSMSSMDERRTQSAIGSVASRFSIGDASSFPASSNPLAHGHEPGVMDLDVNDMAPLREMVLEDTSRDLNFQENRYVQVFSIQNEVLFNPGGTDLSPSGITLLDRLLPVLSQLDYPLLIAGHTSARRDEEGLGYQVVRRPGADITWLLSLRRATAVYRHFIARGLDPAMLTVEAFGQFRPRFSQNTPDGRAANRRVDLVLDRRNRREIDRINGLGPQESKENKPYQYRNFEFDLRMPGDPADSGRSDGRTGGRAPTGWGRP